MFQPADRGTASGVLMALMPVLAAAPDDVVVLTPSDHAVADSDAFRRGVRAAVRFAEDKGAITLYAVEPSEASHDFGWIIPDHRNGHLARVTAFVEKPEIELAESFAVPQAAAYPLLWTGDKTHETPDCTDDGG